MGHGWVGWHGSWWGRVGHVGVGGSYRGGVGESCRGGVCYLGWVGHAGVGGGVM